MRKISRVKMHSNQKFYDKIKQNLSQNEMSNSKYIQMKEQSKYYIWLLNRFLKDMRYPYSASIPWLQLLK